MEERTQTTWERMHPPPRRVPFLVLAHVLLVHSGLAWISLVFFIPALYMSFKLIPGNVPDGVMDGVYSVAGGYLLLASLVVPWTGYPAALLLRSGRWAIAKRVSSRCDADENGPTLTVTYQYKTDEGSDVTFTKSFPRSDALAMTIETRTPRSIAILYDPNKPKRVLILPGQLGGVRDTLDIFTVKVSGELAAKSLSVFGTLFVYSGLLLSIMLRLLYVLYCDELIHWCR